MDARRYLRWGRSVCLAGCVALSGAGGTVLAQPLRTTPDAPRVLPPPQTTPPESVTPPAPAFRAEEVFAPGTEVLCIDLPTALKLADAGNPTIALARLRVEEAYVRLKQAQVLWLPNLDLTPTYLRHDGEIQNATGLVFPTNKSAVAALGGLDMRFETSDALFAPLIARRLVDAQAAAARAVNNDIQLDVSLGYLDLLQAYAQLAVNADILARDQEVLRRAEVAVKAQLSKTGADINRARTEVQLRLQERIGLKGQVRVASSRLARLLLLRPTVALVPTEPAVAPITLVPEDGPPDDLIAVGLMTRPELAQGRALVAASLARLKQSQVRPLLPHLEVAYYAGGFGGGLNDQIHNFNWRGDGSAQAVWELSNLGLGNLAENRVRGAQVGEANLHVVEVQAQVGDEVNEAIQVARARREALDSAQEAVRQAIEMYRRLDLVSFGMTGPKKEYDSLEPLLAIQALAQARAQYLGAVMDYNRAQFQLFRALGSPALEALPKSQPVPVEVPPAPQPYQAPRVPQ